MLADITVVPPTAWPWELLLNDTFTFIASVALRIVFLTVCLKLLLSPLDYYQRYKMRKNQLITQRLKPQMDKLEQQYAGNTKVLQNKKQELNRKSGISMLSSCLPMIVTLVVFIWLWQSLNNVAQFNQFQDYVNMYQVYDSAYSRAIGDSDIDDYAAEYRKEYEIKFAEAFNDTGDIETASATAKAAAELKEDETEDYDALYKDTFIRWFNEIFADYHALGRTDEAAGFGGIAGRMSAIEMASTYCRTVAQRETYNYYYNYGEYAEGGSKAGEAYTMQSFLWIKNVWSPDVPWTAPMKASVAEFKTAAGPWATDSGRSGIEKAELAEIVEMYDTVTFLIHSDESNAVNGWLILPILALLLNVATQLITRRQQKSSGQTQMTEGQSGCMMKVMTFALPVMMFVFAIQYTAVFTLYMVTNALMSLIINLVTTMIAKQVVKAKMPEKAAVGGSIVEKYGRPDPGAPKSTGGNQSSNKYDKKGKKR